MDVDEELACAAVVPGSPGLLDPVVCTGPELATDELTDVEVAA